VRRFKNILYVFEAGSSEKETPRAVLELARANGARLTLCDVAHELPRSFQTMQRALEKFRLERLQELIKDLDDSDVPIAYALRNGIPFLEVIRQVIEGGHDLVIKNAEPGGFSDSSFGTNDMHLMRKCPTPLWIAREDRFGTYRSIVAAIDVDPEVETNPELNRLILDLGTSLARHSGCPLHIAHASWVQSESLLRRVMGSVETPLDELREQRTEAVNQLLAKRDLEGLDVQVHIESQRPEKHVVDVADRVGADLVIMGTVARTGIAGVFIGNTAEPILGHLKCSALTVKPSGFVTPVG
jgi:nucleotide-binding universal stress UspA family protein